MILKISKPVQAGFRQFLVLLRHFLLRLFNNDILKFEDQRRENMIIMLTFFMAGGGIIAVFILMPYLLAMLGYTSETAWVEKNFFMTLSMALTGIISVINWNNMFLDEKDHLYLSSLPVSTNTFIGREVEGLGLWVLFGQFIHGHIRHRGKDHYQVFPDIGESFAEVEFPGISFKESNLKESPAS